MRKSYGLSRKVKLMRAHFLDVDCRRVFPDASTIFEAVKTTKRLYPDAEEFMAFELKDISSL